MLQNTIFIAISALHVSGFTSPSSGAQETCIRFVRVVAITVLLRGEKMGVKSIFPTPPFSPLSNTVIARTLTNRIHVSCAPEDGLVKPETCRALIAIKIVF
jgi:hypothetical protein